MTDETSRWIDLASHPSLAVVLDLDETLWPPGATTDPMDRGFALLLEALHGVGIHVVFLSQRSLELAGRVRARAPHAEWVAKTRPAGELVARLRDRKQGLRVIAIGDGATDETLFEGLAPDDRPLAVRLTSGRRPSAVRAMLWWLVETRRGTSHLLA